jgi:hypothetical protein
MAMVTKVQAFSTGAVQPFAGIQSVRRVYFEPLRSNTHVSYVGDSTVTNDASGTGVIRELAQPDTAKVLVDAFDDRASAGHNTVDASAYWVHGTSGEKMLCTYWTV